MRSSKSGKDKEASGEERECACERHKKNRFSQTQDMTHGAPAKLILGFALPLMLGNVFQQLYTFVDTLVAGQALGVEALAALGAVEWLTFLMFGSIQGLTQGFSVVISQQFGAGEEGKVREAIFHAAVLSAAAACLFTALAEGLAQTALGLLGTPVEIRGLSMTYLRILFAGIPASFLYNASAAVLRAVGNSKTPLHAMTIASVGNIILDLLFVFGFGWGIGGAAAATVIAQLFAGLFCIRKLSENPLLRLRRRECRLDGQQLWKELRLGLPMCFQNAITAAGGLVVQPVSCLP